MIFLEPASVAADFYTFADFNPVNDPALEPALEPTALCISDAALRLAALVYGVKRGGERRDYDGKEGEADYRLLPSYTLFVKSLFADAVAAVFVSVMLGRTVFLSGEAWALASK